MIYTYIYIYIYTHVSIHMCVYIYIWATQDHKPTIFKGLTYPQSWCCLGDAKGQDTVTFSGRSHGES